MQTLHTGNHEREFAMLALRNAEYVSRPLGYRLNPIPEATLVAGGLSLCDATARVTAFGVPLLLRPIEFRLLHRLMRRPERVHTRGELLEQVWGRRVVVGERTIDVHIRRLRISLQPYAMDGWIKTHPTRGYSFSTAL